VEADAVNIQDVVAVLEALDHPFVFRMAEENAVNIQIATRAGLGRHRCARHTVEGNGVTMHDVRKAQRESLRKDQRRFVLLMEAGIDVSIQSAKKVFKVRVWCAGLTEVGGAV
jgi:hypothetical protein